MAKLRVAIVGCGKIAGSEDHPGNPNVGTHLRAYSAHSGVELVAVCDADEARAHVFAEKWRVPSHYTDLRQMLSEAKPELVSICSPNEFHHPQLLLCTEFPVRGILCEKPLALTPADAQTMVKICREKKITLAINYSRRWNPELIQLGDEIRAGKYGAVQSARGYFTKGVFHNASHGINLFESWFGPAKVVSAWNSRPWGNQDVAASFHLTFPRCNDVIFQAASADAYNFFELEILCAEARFVLPAGGNSIRRQLRKQNAGGEPTLEPATETPTSAARLLDFVIQDFVTATTQGSSLVMPATDALQTILTCEEIKTRAQAGSR